MSDPDRAARIRVCDCPEYRYRVCDVCQCVTGVEVADPAPIDWPARFRAAAEVARTYGWGMLPNALGRLARDGTPEEVEAIGQALLGEVS